MSTKILASMGEVNEALCKGQRVAAHFFMGSFGGAGSQADVVRVLNGVAIVNFGYGKDNAGVRFDQAKQWVAYDVMPIETPKQWQQALDNSKPVQCAIDWAEPGTDKTVTGYRVLFIGGSQDGVWWKLRELVSQIQAPAVREINAIGNNPDGPSFEKQTYHLRNIEGVFLYTFESMTKAEVMGKLLEGYNPTNEARH